MRDSQILIHLRQVLTPVMQADYPGVVIVQQDQPTAQGVPTIPTLFVRKISDHRFGSPRIDYGFQIDPNNPTDDTMPTDTVQVIISRFQISGLYPYNPGDPAPITACDMVEHAANLLSVDAILTALRKRGLHLLRILNVVNPTIEDDSAQYAATPSFDVMIQHSSTIAMPVPRILEVAPEIHAV